MFDRSTLRYGAPGVKDAFHCNPSRAGCWIPSRIRAIRIALVGQTAFAGFAAGTFLFMDDYDISRLDTHDNFIIRRMSPGAHLGIGNLIDRAGRAAVPAAGTEVTGSMATRNEKSRDVPLPLHSLKNPPAFQHPVRTCFNTQSAADAVPFVDPGHPAPFGVDHLYCSGARAGHHAEEGMLAGLSRRFREPTEIRRCYKRSGLCKQELFNPFNARELFQVPGQRETHITAPCMQCRDLPRQTLT